MPPMPLNKHDAGRLLKQRREERGLTQEQVVENTTVPNAGYLSNIESGNINPARTKHFPSLAAFLSLSEEDIRSITPLAVFETPASRRPDIDPPGFPEPLYEVSDEIYMPEALKEAIDRFGDDPEYAGLRDPDTQREMALARGFRGGPQTAGEWLSYFIDNKRWLTKKDN